MIIWHRAGSETLASELTAALNADPHLSTNQNQAVNRLVV